jgi:hypothetical protein
MKAILCGVAWLAAFAAGSFNATVSGAVKGSIQGTAVFAQLIGDDADDPAGFHIDLHANGDAYRIEFLRDLASTPKSGHYILGDVESANQPRRDQFIATFRDHADATFGSRAGTLDILTVSAQRMSGRFSFTAGTDTRVTVNGTFDAAH